MKGFEEFKSGMIISIAKCRSWEELGDTFRTIADNLNKKLEEGEGQ